MPSSARSTSTSPLSTLWPEGVLARYLTVAGATVDLWYDSGDVKAKCLGERCPWTERRVTEAYYDDTAEQRASKISAALPGLQQASQSHAEKCRALPRPTA